MDKQQVGNIISLILEQLKGEICTQFSFSYGDELILHFGKLTNYTHPKLRNLQKGTWQLCFRASEWQLFKDGKLKTFSSSHILDQSKELANHIVNIKLIDVVIEQETFKCTLKFDNNSCIELQCDLNDDSDLAHFELFIPENKVLIFGPKLDWKYIDTSTKV